MDSFILINIYSGWYDQRHTRNAIDGFLAHAGSY